MGISLHHEVSDGMYASMARSSTTAQIAKEAGEDQHNSGHTLTVSVRFTELWNFQVLKSSP